MKNNKWLISFTIATFVTTGLVLAVSLFAHSFYDKAGWPADVLTVGLTLCVTAAVSFGTVVAANRLSSRFRVRLPKFFCGTAAILMALLFVVGGIGQAVYSLEYKTQKIKVGEREETQVVEYNENADIVLMMDDSASMNSSKNAIHQVCEAFINRLSEGCNVGGGLFTDRVLRNYYLPLTKMDSQGKQEMIRTITRNGPGGGTGFDNIFDVALEEFSRNSQPDRHHVIVIFTDGQGLMWKEHLSKLQRENVVVYTIRNVTDRSALDRIVKETGGKDVIMNNTADIDTILSALNEMAHHQEEKVTKTPVYETRSGFWLVPGSILYDAQNMQSVYRVIVRMLAFAVYGVLVQLLLFRNTRIGGLAMSAGASLLCGFLVSLASFVRVPIIAIAALALFMFTVFAAGKPGDPQRWLYYNEDGTVNTQYSQYD